MSKRRFEALKREWIRKNRLYPDRGRSIRPWEEGLRRKIREVIAEGLARGYAWARVAAQWWTGLAGQVFSGPDAKEAFEAFESVSGGASAW
ncbi:MAG: hypothetical protein ACP5ME_14680 [Anaerolineae bacterium]